jgi:hypothetical protein
VDTGGQIESGASSGDSKSSDKLVIGFSQVGADSEWRTVNTKSMQEAIKAAGHEIAGEESMYTMDKAEELLPTREY